MENASTAKLLQLYIMMPFMVMGLANCKKESNKNNNNTSTGYLKTEHLKLLHTLTTHADGTAKTVDVKEMSATSDGRLHVLYSESNSFGTPFYYRRIFSAAGDSLATPAIHDDILTLASRNDVVNNWRFMPNSGKLTLSYHPAGSYIYKLYVVDDMTQTYQITDASFGNLPWPCYNDDKLSAYGYQQYFTNGPVYQSQAYFTWNHNGIEYKQVYLHSRSADTVSEDMQRRAYIAEPIDDNILGLCYIDGTHIYIQGYDRNTGVTQTLDSLATSILQPLKRVSVADAGMTVRTSRDRQKMIFLIKYDSGAYPGDGMNKFATFIYDKITKKLSKVVADFTVPNNVYPMNCDDDGNLLYARADDETDRYAWSIYKTGAAGTPLQLAHVSAKTPTYAYVSRVQELNGRIYVCVSQSSVANSTLGALSYMMVVE